MRDSQFSSKIKLPQLPFGEKNSVDQADLDAYCSRMATVVTSLKKYEAVDGADSFRYKSSVININGMKIIAAANTPVEVDVGDSMDTTLMIPFHGQCISKVGSTQHLWQAGESAMFLPAMSRGGGSGTRATLTIDLSPERLQSVARSMLGASAETNIDLQLHADRVLALNTHNVSFDKIFHNLCGVIDSFIDQPDALALTGIDDIFYRNIVLMMQPGLFIQPHNSTPNKPSRRELDQVCEYIQANLGDPLTLSDIERVSGMSARKLQYAFFERFACTPMQWVRDQRLNLVHHRLKNASEGDTVTSVATTCGFTNLGVFSNLYQERFQQFPSVTLKYALR